MLKDVVKALRAAVGPDAWSQGLFRLEIDGAQRDGRGRLGARRVHLRRRCSTTTRRTAGSHYTLALVLRHKGDEAGAEPGVRGGEALLA